MWQAWARQELLRVAARFEGRRRARGRGHLRALKAPFLGTRSRTVYHPGPCQIVCPTSSCEHHTATQANRQKVSGL